MGDFCGEHEDNDVDNFDDDLTDAEHATEGVNFRIPLRSFVKLHHSSVSFTATLVHTICILRTREQVYLSLLYLTISKLFCVFLGNSVLATFVKYFHKVCATLMDQREKTCSETLAFRS